MPDLLDPLNVLMASRATRAARPAIPDLTEEEEQTLLGRLISGVSWVGETIDKPFAATRGLIAGGGPEQLLWTVPFSESIGFAPKKKYSGRDVLEEWGVLRRNRPGFDAGDVAGFAVDLLAGPPIPVVGPLTKAGKALATAGKLAKPTKEVGKVTEAMLKGLKEAKALGGGRAGGLTGLTPAAIGEEIRTGMRAPVGLSLPWPLNTITGIKQPLATFGAGSETAAKVWEAAHYGGGRLNPIAAFRQLFSYPVKGVGDPEAQRALDVAYTRMRNAHAVVSDLYPSQKMVYEDLGRKYAELAKWADVAGDTTGKSTWDEAAAYLAQERSLIEGASHLTEQELANVFRIPAEAPQAAAKVAEFAAGFSELLDNSLSKVMKQQYTEWIKLGGRGDFLDDTFAAYFPRRIDNPVAAKAMENLKGRLLPTSFSHALRRKDPFRDVPEGRLTLARWARNPLTTHARSRPVVPHSPLTRMVALGSVDEFMAGRGREFFALGDVIELGDGRVGWLVGLQRHKPAKVLVGTAGPEGELLEEVIELAPNQLRRGAVHGDDLMPRNPLTADQQKAVMREALKVRHGIEAPSEAQALREMYAWKEILEPAALRREATPEQMTLLRDGVDAVLDEKTQAVVQEGVESKVRQLSQYFRGVPTGAAPFNRTMMADYLGYMDHLTDSVSNLQSVHNFLGGVVNSARIEDSLPIGEVWRSALTRSREPALTQAGLDSFLTRYAQQQNLPVDPESLARMAADLTVPQKSVKVLQTYVDLLDPRSDVTGTLGAMFDGWTAAVKAGWTIPHVSFHTRNLETGVFQNLAAHAPYSARQLGTAYTDIFRYLRKPAKYDLPYLDEIQDLGVVQQGQIYDIARYGKGVEAAQQVGELPGGGLGWVLGGLKPKTLDPRKFRGWPEEFGGLKEVGEAQFPIFEAGDRAYRLVETLNRVPPYIAARRAGYTPAQAKHLVDNVQYIYNKMTPFESKLRRFGFPFYGWMKNNLPYQFKTLFMSPIGPSPQVVRMMVALQGLAPGYTPNWVRERLGMPLGTTKEGKQGYIRSFGLPFEDLSDLVFTADRPWMPLALQRTSERGVARMHPAIGLAFRLYTGRDPYTDRPVKDLKGPTGLPTLDMLWQAGPLSRFRTEYWGKLGKIPEQPVLAAVDFLTGVKTGRYDPNKWKPIELAKAIQQKAAEHPEVRKFETFYIPKTRREEASPEALRDIDVLNLLARSRRQARQAELEGRKK